MRHFADADGEAVGCRRPVADPVTEILEVVVAVKHLEYLTRQEA